MGDMAEFAELKAFEMMELLEDVGRAGTCKDCTWMWIDEQPDPRYWCGCPQTRTGLTQLHYTCPQFHQKAAG